MTHLQLVDEKYPTTPATVPMSGVVARAAIRNQRRTLLFLARTTRILATSPIFDMKRAAYLYGLSDGQREAARLLRGLDR